MDYVVIAEDEPAIVELYKALISVKGSQLGVSVAPNVDASIENLEELLREGHTVKLVITDGNMPGGKSGLDFVDYLQKNHQGVPVVFASANPEMLERAAGMDVKTLSKPFNLNVFYSLMEKYL